MDLLIINCLQNTALGLLCKVSQFLLFAVFAVIFAITFQHFCLVEYSSCLSWPIAVVLEADVLYWEAAANHRPVPVAIGWESMRGERQSCALLCAHWSAVMRKAGQGRTPFKLPLKFQC